MARLRSALPKSVGLFYSVKANPHSSLVAELVRSGLRTEISSSGELDAILAAEAAPEQSVYTGPGKTFGELSTAIRAGVQLFSVESETELARLRDAAEDAESTVDYLIRVNNGKPSGGSGLRMMGGASQFGVDIANLMSGRGLLGSHRRVNPVGMHFFAVSGAADEDALLAEFEHSLQTAKALTERTGAPLRMLDLGGGFAAPYAAPGDAPVYGRTAAVLENLLDRYFSSWRTGAPEVTVESGRALVASCGVLHTSVVDVKHTAGTTYVVLDAGVNTLGGMVGLGRLLAPSATPEPIAGREREATATVTLVGPLCTPLDIHHRRIEMPLPRVGDVLTFPNTGAYGLSASLLGFLGRPAAAEVVVDGDRVVAARRLDLIATELKTND
ncbi:Diaminopimelate decarboxylase OS=Streptomyces alboniger OX=132473 GN=lysA PE=3 SV=1 [Streptomyces alboniger]